MVFSPSLPPNHSKTTRILPESCAAACRLAWLKTRGTGPNPPSRPNPSPPAPIRIMSRRVTPESLSRCLLGIASSRTQPADADSGNLAHPAARQPELAVRCNHHMTHDPSTRRNRPFLECGRARIEAHERIRLDLGLAVPDRSVGGGGHAVRPAVGSTRRAIFLDLFC